VPQRLETQLIHNAKLDIGACPPTERSRTARCCAGALTCRDCRCDESISPENWCAPAQTYRSPRLSKVPRVVCTRRSPGKVGTRRVEAEHHAKARTCMLAATCACTHVPLPPHGPAMPYSAWRQAHYGADRYHLHDWSENAVRGYVQGADCSRHEHRAA